MKWAGACYRAVKLSLPCIVKGSLIQKLELSEIDRGAYGYLIVNLKHHNLKQLKRKSYHSPAVTATKYRILPTITTC